MSEQQALAKSQITTSGNAGGLAVVGESAGNNSLTRLNMQELKELAAVLVESGAFPDLKTLAQAQVKIIFGAELGFSPLVSVTGIHFFQGKVECSSTLKASLIKSSGKYDYKIIEHTDDRCEVAFFQLRNNEWVSCGVPIVYTAQDATNAGLINKDNWKKFRKDMLFSACIRQGQRRYCADTLHGIGDEVDSPVAQNEIIDASAIEDASAQNQTVDGEIVTDTTPDGTVVDTATGEVVAEPQTPPAPEQEPVQQTLVSTDSTAAPAPAPPPAAQNGKVKTACNLANKLQEEHGVEFEALAMQFLPEGVAKFEDLTENDAAGIIPGLAELLTNKVQNA